MDRTDQDIARSLRLILAVQTEAQGIRNDIVEVKSDSLVVRSAQTSEERTIPFRDLRRAGSVTSNSQIVRVLARILGLYDGDI
jgi:hypothetical protein